MAFLGIDVGTGGTRALIIDSAIANTAISKSDSAIDTIRFGCAANWRRTSWKRRPPSRAPTLISDRPLAKLFGVVVVVFLRRDRHTAQNFFRPKSHQ